jgi:hypothetical protein
MNSDSLTYNPHPLPLENNSVFKMFIQSQDEVVGVNPVISSTGSSMGFSLGIRQKSFVKDSALCTSMFHQKDKSNQVLEPKLRTEYGTDWMFFTFLICLIIATIFTFKNNKRISQLFKAFLVPHFTNQLIREGNIIREFFIYPLLAVYFISSTFLISSLLLHFFHYEINMTQGLYIALAVFAFFLFKIFVINIIGWVFHTTKETFEYLTNYLVFSVVLGVFLFPFVFLLIYTTPAVADVLLYVVLIIFAIIFVYRTIRGLLVGLSSERYSLHYLFLYLCTVEILPLSITVKLLINFSLTGYLLK